MCQAGERGEEDPFRKCRIGCKRASEPVGIGFELADQLIDSIPFESFHATFAQGTPPRGEKLLRRYNKARSFNSR